MNSLEIHYHSYMDKNLCSIWAGWEYHVPTDINWIEFLYTLPHIESASMSTVSTIIKFDSEAAKTWFLLRWS